MLLLSPFSLRSENVEQLTVENEKYKNTEF
jgi:hypothetical protein